MQKTTLAAALFAALAAVPSIAAAQAAPAAPAAKEPLTVTGNVALVSDYRFRGISQTLRRPAIQGGFDIAHESGLYFGNWNSSVNSSDQYTNGAGVEMDLYGGYKFEPLKDLALDVGVLRYQYPGARYTGTSERFHNTELYVGGAYGPVSAKVSYAVTDYFGLNSASATALGVTPRGDSKGTMYFDLNYTQELMPKLTLQAHVGRTRFNSYDEFSYTDYKLGVSYDLKDGLLLGAAWVGNSGGSQFKAFNTSVPQGTELYKSAVVLSLGKTF